MLSKPIDQEIKITIQFPRVPDVIYELVLNAIGEGDLKTDTSKSPKIICITCTVMGTPNSELFFEDMKQRIIDVLTDFIEKSHINFHLS